jgi:hypothetical protein
MMRTWLPQNPTDVAPIDHTERRHDVTFISVDVESQEDLCTFGKIKHCLYEHTVEFSSEKLMRYRELCIDAQNPSKSFQNLFQGTLFTATPDVRGTNIQYLDYQLDVLPVEPCI